MPVGKTRVVRVVDYDPQWPLTFADLSNVIEAALGDLVLSIEHVGSTSIPGLAALPIIDLDAVIESREILPHVVQSLAGLGYSHEGDLGVSGREAFRRHGHDVPRDGTGRLWANHHLYVCARDNRGLAEHVAFRNYLREHPDEASEYGELKRRLAERYRHDVDAYINGKDAFVERVLRRAMP